MTDKFEVPEDAVRMAGMCSPRYRVCAAADVPSLCRQEVERALRECRVHVFETTSEDRSAARVSGADARAYLAARFPEAASEPKRVYPCNEPECVKCRTYEGHPTPSAPAEHKCPCGFALKECVDCTIGPTRNSASSPEELCHHEAPVMFMPDGYPLCTLPKGHAGNHQHKEQLRWLAAPPSEAPAEECAAESKPDGEGWMCTLVKGHLGQHEAWLEGELLEKWAAARPEAKLYCGERVSTIAPHCTKPRGHRGPHDPEPCTACACADCTTDRNLVRSSVSLTEAERAFVRELAFVFGNNMPFAYTESGDENVRVGHNHDVAIAARKIRP